MKRNAALLLIFTLFLTAYSRTLPRLKRTPQPVAIEAFDTIADPRPDAVRFSGYEKANTSNRETFFATNNLDGDSTITAIELTITYFDSAGRQLHERTELIKCLIPPGETRAMSLRSWDTNHAFHYYLSTPPRTRRSSPFSVRSTLRRLVVDTQE